MMKNALIVIFIFLTTIIVAQNDLDKHYTPPVGSIFNNNPKTNGSITNKSAFRFAPTMLLRQKVFGFYEVEISKPITFLAGIGKAFGDDVFQKAFVTVFTGWDTDQPQLHISSILDNSTFDGSTPYLMTGFRSYLGKQCFDGVYLDVTYRFERSTYKLNDEYIKNINYTSAIKKVNVTTHHIALSFGSTSRFGPNDKLIQDIYISVGLKLVNYDEIVRHQQSGPITEYYERSGGTLSEHIVPAINIGYAIGFGF